MLILPGVFAMRLWMQWASPLQYRRKSLSWACPPEGSSPVRERCAWGKISDCGKYCQWHRNRTMCVNKVPKERKHSGTVLFFVLPLPLGREFLSVRNCAGSLALLQSSRMTSECNTGLVLPILEMLWIIQMNSQAGLEPPSALSSVFVCMQPHTHTHTHTHTRARVCARLICCLQRQFFGEKAT